MAKFKIDKKPKKVHKFIAKTFFATRYTNHPFFKMFQRGLETTGGYNWWGNGIYGKGVRVGIMDSGLFAASPFYSKAVASGKVVGFSFVPGEDWTEDGTGHGTHVSSQVYHDFNLEDVVRYKEIICCACPYLDKLIMYKVLDNAGQGQLQNTYNALEFILNTPKEQRPHIINGSFSSDAIDSPEITSLLKKLTDEGIIFNFAAGNTGPDSDGDSIRYPANQADGNKIWAITAFEGGVNQLAKLSYYSSYGPKASASLPGDLQLGVSNDPKGGYAVKSGTSMAAPIKTAFDANVISYLSGQHPENAFNVTQYLDLFYRSNGFYFDAGAPGVDSMFGKGIIWFRDGYQLKPV